MLKLRIVGNPTATFSLLSIHESKQAYVAGLLT